MIDRFIDFLKSMVMGSQEHLVKNNSSLRTFNPETTHIQRWMRHKQSPWDQWFPNCKSITTKQATNLIPIQCGKTDLQNWSKTSIWVGELFKSLGLVYPWMKSFTLIFVGEMDVDNIRWWWIKFIFWISRLPGEMIQIDEYIFRMNGNHPKKAMAKYLQV